MTIEYLLFDWLYLKLTKAKSIAMTGPKKNDQYCLSRIPSKSVISYPESRCLDIEWNKF